MLSSPFQVLIRARAGKLTKLLFNLYHSCIALINSMLTFCGSASNVGHSSSGTSGTVASGRQRAPVSTVPEVSEEVSTTSSRRTQQGRSK